MVVVTEPYVLVRVAEANSAMVLRREQWSLTTYVSTALFNFYIEILSIQLMATKVLVLHRMCNSLYHSARKRRSVDEEATCFLIEAHTG